MLSDDDCNDLTNRERSRTRLVRSFLFFPLTDFPQRRLVNHCYRAQQVAFKLDIKTADCPNADFSLLGVFPGNADRAVEQNKIKMDHYLFMYLFMWI